MNFHDLWFFGWRVICFFFGWNYSILQKPNTELTYDSVNTNEDIYDYLSIITPYRTEANTDPDSLMDKNCQPKKIWMIIRSATRYPPKFLINHLDQIKNEIVTRGKLSDKEKKDFDNWNSDQYGLNDLPKEGIDEITNLATRMKNRFPSLFDRLELSTDQKTFNIDARNAFYKAVFGQEVSADKKYTYTPNSLVFTMPESCKSMKNAFSIGTKEWTDRFTKWTDLDDICREISDRFGITFTRAEGGDVFYAYAHESAWKRNRDSIWKKLINLRLAKAMDFATDSYYYDIDGYKDPSHYEPVCEILREIVYEFFAKPVDTKGKIYFTDNGMLMKFFALLGLYKDTQHLSFRTADMRRKWKLSKIAGFASNLAFILYECSDGLFVSLLHQERLVEIPACGTKCKFEDFQRIYHKQLISCDYNKMCG